MGRQTLRDTDDPSDRVGRSERPESVAKVNRNAAPFAVANAVH